MDKIIMSKLNNNQNSPCQWFISLFKKDSISREDISNNDQYNRTQKSVLILVINSLKKDFVESLKTQRKIESQDCDQLYRATRYLWLGTESEFFNSPFKSHDNFLVGEGQEESEYDVYLIKIKLDYPFDGFKPNVNQLERISAFRTLADSNVEISDRLRVEVFRDTGVYNR